VTSTHAGAGPRAPSPLHSGRPSALPVTPSRSLHTAAGAPADAATTRTPKWCCKKKLWTKLSVAQLRVIRWMETEGVEFSKFVRADAETDAASIVRRPKGVVEEDVLHSLCDGVQLCALVERLEQVQLRGVLPRESCVYRAPKVQNLEKMLGVLRDKRRSMPSRYVCIHICLSI